MEERFQCVLSHGSAVATGVLLGVLGLVAIGMVVLFLWVGARTGWPAPVKWSTLIPGLVILLLAAVVAGTWAYSPRAVVISAESVAVERLVSPVVIPLASISSVRLAAAGDFRGTLRTFGSSGLWGSMGHFHSPALGNFRMYSTDMADAVIVDAGERFVLTPHEKVRFVAALQQRLAARHGQPGAGGA
jgi:hypothetical protein